MLRAPMDFLDLFPDATYRHRMRFQRGTVAGFFGRGDDHEAVLRQRRMWLERDAAACLALRPEGCAAVDEMTALMAGESLLDPAVVEMNLPARMAALGGTLEPDFLLLSPDASGQFRLVAGC